MIQSVIFNKNYYTINDAILWLEYNGYKYPIRIDETKNYYRMRQFNPKKNKYYRTINLNKYIKLIYEY